MKNLAAVCAVLVALPFLLGYIHAGTKKGIYSTFIYYRYYKVLKRIPVSPQTI